MCLTCEHVVFYVKDLQRSLVFYRDLSGFKEVGQAFNRAAAAGPCACRGLIKLKHMVRQTLA
jgi:catechol 2,3-dioxygenase-like lactoylglutathione lyase family enzyme